MKTIYYYLIASVVLGGVNIWSWTITNRIDYQLGWIAFLLVWINLVLAWILYSKSQAIMYFFLTSSLVIEVLLIINYFWIQQLGKGL